MAIIEAYGFVELPRKATSHRRYRGVINGRVCMVTVAFHSLGDEIKPDTLASMIRQSGLPRHLFRK
ncbi:MAG TPA: type II toxin-antitoxin system HicA family toxin [Xanthobacteraceae bacterium]